MKPGGPGESMPTLQPLRPGRRIADGKIAAGRHQGAADAEFRQDGERRVGGVAFGDASEVQAHACLVERDRSGGGVQMELAISASVAAPRGARRAREGDAAGGPASTTR